MEQSGEKWNGACECPEADSVPVQSQYVIEHLQISGDVGKFLSRQEIEACIRHDVAKGLQVGECDDNVPQCLQTNNQNAIRRSRFAPRDGTRCFLLVGRDFWWCSLQRAHRWELWFTVSEFLNKAGSLSSLSLIPTPGGLQSS